MPLLFLQQWIPAGALHALGWTFIHSLWLGLLAAMFAAIIMMGTRKSTAHLRYQLLCLVMSSFIIATFATFCYYWQLPVTTTDDAVAANATIITNVITSGSPVIVAENTGIVEKLSAWLDANMNVIVIVWALFFVMNSLKLFTGLASVNRLRQYRTKKAPAIWENKLPKLVASLGIKQKVTLLQSALVKVPVAVGVLRPVVLVPIGLLMHLPAEQAETILLHELAHIKRKDYLVNLLQRFAEAIFFFNPALLWISSLIRIEREACCDDVVLAHTTQRRDYLEALVAFQEYTAPLPSYALGISNKKNQLLQRVRRIITMENRKAGWAERLVLLAGVVFLMAFTAIKQQDAANEEIKAEPVSNAIDNASRNQLQSVRTLQSQTLPGATFIGGIQDNSFDEIKRTSIAVVPAKQLRLSPSDRTRNMSLSNLVYRDTPRVKIQPAIVQPINKTTYTITNHSYHKNKDGYSKESVTAIGLGGVNYFFLMENDKLEKIKVNGKNIAENDFQKYNDVFQAVSRELQTNSGKPSGEEMDKMLKKAEADVKIKEEYLKREMNRVESEMKELEDRIERNRVKTEEKKAKEENKVKVSDGRNGEGKTRIEVPRTDESKPRVNEQPRTPEGKKANEGKPANEGTKTKPGVNISYTPNYNNTTTSQKTENKSGNREKSKEVAIELKQDIKIDANEWNAEGKWNADGKWDIDINSNFLVKSDNKLFQGSRENLFKENKKAFDLKPRRAPDAPKVRHKPPKSPDEKNPKEQTVSQPDSKEKPTHPKIKIDL